MENKETDGILYKEDLIKRYAEGRKALSERDVADLLNCLVMYLKESANNIHSPHYAFEIPQIGFLYRKLKRNNLHTAVHLKYENQIKEIMFTPKTIPLIKTIPRIDTNLKRMVTGGITIEELEIKQNEIANAI